MQLACTRAASSRQGSRSHSAQPPVPARARVSAASSAGSSASAAADPWSWAPPPPPGGPWDAVQRWVVFSDLHVSARSETVCLEVLQKARRGPRTPRGC